MAPQNARSRADRIHVAGKLLPRPGVKGEEHSLLSARIGGHEDAAAVRRQRCVRDGCLASRRIQRPRFSTRGIDEVEVVVVVRGSADQGEHLAIGANVDHEAGLLGSVELLWCLAAGNRKTVQSGRRRFILATRVEDSIRELGRREREVSVHNLAGREFRQVLAVKVHAPEAPVLIGTLIRREDHVLAVVRDDEVAHPIGCPHQALRWRIRTSGSRDVELIDAIAVRAEHQPLAVRHKPASVVHERIDERRDLLGQLGIADGSSAGRRVGIARSRPRSFRAGWCRRNSWRNR